jgi:hypothetical protein
VEQRGVEPLSSQETNTLSTSLFGFSKPTKYLLFIRYFILLPCLFVKAISSVETGLLGRFCRLLFPYAAIASSALSANMRPLVREVGIDIMSSAFVVLNLFKVV